MAQLDLYRGKRDFKRTAEPRGRAGRAKGHTYVIQKHAARRLHYDLRLELDGVLKSWAVTKGPSLVPGDKRLAVEVEDHPLDYGGFEGRIPKGQYGGGNVIVWDHGTWEPDHDPHRGLAKGHLDFTLHGEKLGGHWHLVRMRGKPREKRKNWLLIKSEDEAAREPGEPDILEELPDFVVSGAAVDDVDAKPAKTTTSPRTNSTGQRGASAAAPKKAANPNRATPGKSVTPSDYGAIAGTRQASMPRFVEPCLATLKPRAPEGRAWVHEIKFDGYRLQARIADGKVQFRTRTGLDWTKRFGAQIARALTELPVKSALIDGEMVVEGEAGASDFSLLQNDLGAHRADRMVFYAFDLLHANGYDLTGALLVARKAALASMVARQPEGSPLRLSEHFDGDGTLMLTHACRLSLEGIISKRGDAPYRPGRGGDWIKTKCTARQEFVIAGYVPSTTAKKAIGSLALGYHDGDDLIYAGRVGTGFSDALAGQFYRQLERLAAKTAPFRQRLSAAETRGVHWVKPDLVAEVEFRGWTEAKLLRHASFRGLREDKPAAKVLREDAPEPVAQPMRARGSGVKLSHPDRVYWPDIGLTKHGLADYYSDVWRWIAPHIVARPLSLLRCPGGIEQQCFFQKQPWKGLQRSIQVVDNPGDGGNQVLVVRDLEGLIAMVQAGVLEIHPWGATVGDLDHPDRLVIDLDPGPGVAWSAMMVAAREARERFKADRLESFLKTSGGKGLHVVVPLTSKVGWDDAKAYTRGIALAMAKDSPDRYTATMAKTARKDCIFVDYLRNGCGNTAIAAYSSRARTGAPVSMPLQWDELTAEICSDYFNVANTPARLVNLSADPWSGFFKIRQSLPSVSRRRR